MATHRGHPRREIGNLARVIGCRRRILGRGDPGLSITVSAEFAAGRRLEGRRGDSNLQGVDGGRLLRCGGTVLTLCGALLRNDPAVLRLRGAWASRKNGQTRGQAAPARPTCNSAIAADCWDIVSPFCARAVDCWLMMSVFCRSISAWLATVALQHRKARRSGERISASGRVLRSDAQQSRDIPGFFRSSGPPGEGFCGHNDLVSVGLHGRLPHRPQHQHRGRQRTHHRTGGVTDSALPTPGPPRLWGAPSRKFGSDAVHTARLWPGYGPVAARLRPERRRVPVSCCGRAGETG